MMKWVYIQKVKCHLHSDALMFSKNTFFLAIIQCHNLGTEVIVIIFHIWSDAEVMSLIVGAHLEPVATVYILCAAKYVMGILKKNT